MLARVVRVGYVAVVPYSPLCELVRWTLPGSTIYRRVLRYARQNQGFFSKPRKARAVLSQVYKR